MLDLSAPLRLFLIEHFLPEPHGEKFNAACHKFSDRLLSLFGVRFVFPIPFTYILNYSKADVSKAFQKAFLDRFNTTYFVRIKNIPNLSKDLSQKYNSQHKHMKTIKKQGPLQILERAYNHQNCRKAYNSGESQDVNCTEEQ